jgi:general secretion pathway protein A
VALSGSEAQAFHTLFNLYGINTDVQPKRDPCRQAEELGMRCYAARGGLSDLLLIDQPVIMRLASPGGQEYSVTLTGLDMKEQMAILNIAGVDRRVAVNDLATAWSGKYVMIWKVPTGFQDVGANQRGPAVTWLRETMAAVDGIANDGGDRFDAALGRRIRAFQLSEGIQPDGLVGPLTAIHLNARSGQGGPRLVIRKKG